MKEAPGDDVKDMEVAERFVFPASFAQQRLWFLDRLEPGSSVYNVPQVARIRAPLDPRALELSIQEILRRHEALRTTFESRDGEPVQVIAAEQKFTLRVIDLSRRAAEERETEAKSLALEDSAKAFDLAVGPLFRVTLVKMGDEDHLLLVTIHHIVSDGWSLGVFFRELAELYRAFSEGKLSPLPPLPIQYADYAVWQREWMRGERLEAQLAYWKERMAGAPTLLELPTDKPRPPVQAFRGARLQCALPESLVDELRRLSRAEGVTPFMTLLAAFQTLLSRYSGQEDVVVGTPIAGRGRTETEGLIGLFVNTLPLRTSLSGDPTFREVLSRARKVALGALGNQDLPLDRLVEELHPPRSLAHAPLFQVVFALENTPRPASKFPGLVLESLDVDRGVARADLSLFMTEEPGSLPYKLEYSTDLFDAATIGRLAEHFLTLLEGVVASPGQTISRLPLLTAAERSRILGESRGAAEPPAPGTTIPALFEENARKWRDKVAVVCEGRRLTYGELNARANCIAHALRGRGVAPGSLVALCVRRSLEMIAGILGVLKAGGAYVPIDPSYPRERISYLISDSGAKLLLTDETVAPALEASGVETLLLDRDWPEIARESSQNPAPSAGTDDLAYAIYTSGSTGRPKGVLVRHAGVANLFAATRGELGFDESDVWTIFHSFAFDLSVWELWGPLLHGGRLVIVPVETAQSPLEFARLLKEEGVTVVSQTPVAARRLAAVRRDPASGSADWRLRIFVCGGEALPSDLAAELLSWNVPLWNFYGPTEATVWTTIKRVGPADCGGGFVSIGRPIANTAAYVLDAHREPVPEGVAGDLYLGGAGLARGYLRRPELDSECFVPDPFGGPKNSRLYRTGDRARRLRGGDLEFLGRDDHQVKLRGYRVELGEIETALAEHPQVREAAAMVREDEPGDQRLVAYYASVPGDPPGAGALRAFLLERLPEYMVPQVFVTLEAIPLTSNAKVDRRALPAPGSERPELERLFVAPRTPTEEKLAEIWRRLLALDQVGVEDNFFELGGHSLKATQAIARVKDVFGVELPLRSLFEAPTVAGLARRIEERKTGRSESRPPLRRVDRDRPLPVSFGQQRLWFLDRLEPGSSAYNVPRAVRLRGKLDLPALQESLDAISTRHESLRTSFAESEGEPTQVVSRLESAPLVTIDLSGLPAGRREAEVSRSLSEESARTFDLSRAPLWRAVLLTMSPEEHVLLVVMHHIVGDGWSFGVFFEELGKCYAGFHSGRPAVLPDLPIQYADYAAWQREWLRGPELEKLMDYWRSRLAGAPERLELTGARERPAKASSRGAVHTGVLSLKTRRALEALSRTEGTTLFTTLLAAFQALLSRDAKGRDVVIGTDVANRNRIETERLIGFFVNLLPIRTDLSGNPTFRDLLARAHESALGAYAHQDLPFEKLVEELRPARVLGVNPLVQVLIVQSPPRETLQLPGLLAEKFALPVEKSRFDLVLFVGESDGTVVTSWLYDSDLFERTEIERHADRFERLLTAIATDPDARLEALEARTDGEKGQIAMEKGGRREAQASRLRGARRQGVDIARATAVVEESFGGDRKFPLVIRPADGADLDLVEWASTRRDELEGKLLEHGAILFRDFGVGSAGEFERFASGLCRGELFGEYGDLPREAVGGRVYGSTPYPPDQPILFHNESSHMHRWPMKIWFHCVIAAERGGETPIVDCRRVLARLDPALRDRFARKGLMYVRNYTEGLDVGWEEFYGTSDRARVEELCRKAGAEFEWRGEKNLRTRQRCPAVVRHPQTGELAFFNQLQLHHVSCLDAAVRESLTSMLREEDLPRNVTYGDGSPIEDSVMAEAGAAYRDCAVGFPWTPGDVLMLNNMLVAHSRNPYVGPRKIVVAMGEMINQSEIRN